ncbi:uncharacterized protein [Diadema setosum]|uniref:uncharacterized protein n=1 Tax=Diadema setosum TaxID=31175 RepID=UPI003B3BDF70
MLQRLQLPPSTSQNPTLQLGQHVQRLPYCSQNPSQKPSQNPTLHLRQPHQQLLPTSRHSYTVEPQPPSIPHNISRGYNHLVSPDAWAALVVKVEALQDEVGKLQAWKSEEMERRPKDSSLEEVGRDPGSSGARPCVREAGASD